MTDERMREVCKSYFFGMTIPEIVELEEDLTTEDVIGAINDGKVDGIFDELQQMQDNVKGDE